MTVHVIGAGVAGLACATALAAKGVKAALYEGAPQAGGRWPLLFRSGARARSSTTATTWCCRATAPSTPISRASARRTLSPVPAARVFDFVDVTSGERWTIAPNEGPLPWWVASPRRRVPGTRLSDYLGLAGMLWPGESKRICDAMRCDGPLWERLMRPFLLAALNTEPETASASLAAAVIRETLAKGGRAYRPRIAHPTLAAAFVDPALAFLAQKGVEVQLGQRLRRLVLDGTRACALEFPERTVPLADGDKVVLAVPPWAAQELLPRLAAAGRVPRHRQRPFHACPAGRRAADARRDRRHRGMDLLFPRPHLDHDQRRRPAGRHGPRGAGGADLARRRGSFEARRGDAGLADRQGAARDLRRHAAAGGEAAGRAHALGQSVARRRLDGDGLACDHRRGDTLGPQGGRAAWNQIDNTLQLEATIRGATRALLDRQRPDGHWVFELEADATIPSEYVLLVHHLAETPNLELERKIGIYLRRIQADHGGWPLYHGGTLDISATVEGLFRAQDDRRRHRRAAHGRAPAKALLAAAAR